MAAPDQAESLNEASKILVGRKRYEIAIETFTEAITLCPNIAKYYANRAICYRKLRSWTKVEADSRRAIELDSRYFKAHYILGVALVELQDFAGGIKELEKALDIEGNDNQQSEQVMEIRRILANAKYREWEFLSSKRDSKLLSLKEFCEKALREYHFRHDFQASNETGNDLIEQLKLLDEVFREIQSINMPTEVPDHLCCKISLHLLQDPVVTPSGITYEKAMIMQHLDTGDNFDPSTREPLERNQLVPNRAIKHYKKTHD
ncbi:E3 ubiquitin-protein ligase CHIP-like [Curcuma longa]|uniref:E3 ubiquitin-protein ligase CHIP-like n=1 Tax=Curcuma longa TaxID=136217 RepID=UPI003D9DCD04